MCGEKAWRQLHRNAVRNIEQVLEAAPHKEAAVRPLTPITKAIQVRRTRHAEHCWRIGGDSQVVYSGGPLHMDEQRQDDQLEPTYNSSVLIQDVALKTCRKQWTIEKGGKKESGISVLMVWHDDHDDIQHFNVRVELKYELLDAYWKLLFYGTV